MSAHDNEELVNYEDEDDVLPHGSAAAAMNGVTVSAAADGDGEKDKKNFSGIHSTGFRLVFVSFSHKKGRPPDLAINFLSGISC